MRAETFENFPQIRESLRREKFYIDRFAKFFNFFFFSPNLLAALDIALILVSWRKMSRHKCNTKTRPASVAIWVLEKMFGARKRGLIRQKLEIISFFSLSFISIWIHSRKFKTRNAKISRIFRLAKVSAPKVVGCLARYQKLYIPYIDKFLHVYI